MRQSASRDCFGTNKKFVCICALEKTKIKDVFTATHVFTFDYQMGTFAETAIVDYRLPFDD
jgi:hypothetical protein